MEDAYCLKQFGLFKFKFYCFQVWNFTAGDWQVKDGSSKLKSPRIYEKVFYCSGAH